MRVLVCGGRTYANTIYLFNRLDSINESRAIETVIHGQAAGADTLADQWAFYRGIPAQSFPANWKLHGERAGPIRNQQMLDEGKPDLVVAFPGGPGTRDMVSRAKKAGLKVIEFKR